MHIYTLVGKNIRLLRKQASLSQEELAFRAGIDRAYLSQIENGHRNISLMLLTQLATELNTSPADLLQEKPE